MPAPPAAQGLYDPASSTTPAASPSSPPCPACRRTTIVDQGLTALRNLEHRGASGAEPDTGDGAGILLQVPDAFLRAVVDFAAAARGRVRRRHRVPARRRRRGAAPRARSSAIAAEEGLTVLGWRDVPTDPDLVGATARAVDAGVPAAVRRRRRPAGSSGLALERLAFCAAQAGRARDRRRTSRRCPRAPSSTRACSPPSQLEPFFPDLSDAPVRQRARPGALAVLDQHVPVAGRWRTRTASSRTTARSTPCAATATGCRPARRSSPATCIPGDLRAAVPDLHARTPATRRASTRCSSCCTSAAARCRTRC